MLVQLLPAEVFAYFLVFSRVGAAIMFMPGFGESYVTPRARLVIAVALALLLTPVLAGVLPGLPASPLAVFVILAGEITVGAFLGLIGRIILAALHTAGTVVAFQIGIANALGYDPVAVEQSAVPALMLSTAGVLVVFAADLHHLMLMALAESYTVFVPGTPPQIDDMSMSITRLVADSFLLGVQLSSPFIVVGLVFYLGVGVLARLMPQVQVFFVAIPVQILIGIMILAVTIGAVMTWFLEQFPEIFARALGG